MAIYLLKSVLCSALLLLGYQLLLKNKNTYQFNRMYLLLSLVFSLAIPFVTIEQPKAAFIPAKPVIEQLNAFPVDNIQEGKIIDQPAATRRDYISRSPATVNYMPYLVTGLYGLIVLILLGRFIKNIVTINLSAKNNKKLPYRDAWLVLIKEKLTPHTFMNYIFINSDDYANNRIEEDVLKHELTHAQQWHSADVMFIGLLQVICWFNPFIFLYRKAIQLNHEFIADAAVINGNSDVSGYQYLLLEKISGLAASDITCQFNYSVTKKRLIMMTKKTSAVTAAIARLAVIPLMAGAFALFCTKTEAQPDKPAIKYATQNQDTTDAKMPGFRVKDNPRPDEVRFPSTKKGAPAPLLNEYKAIVAKYPRAENGRVQHPEKITQADKDQLIAIYKQMSPAQQQQQSIGFTETPPPPPLPAEKVPTGQQLKSWASAPGYSVIVDFKKIKNADLAKFKPADIHFAGDYPTGKKHKRYIDIWTKAYAEKYRKYQAGYKPGTVMFFRFLPPHVAFAMPKLIRPDFPCSKDGLSVDLLKEYADISAKYTAPGSKLHAITKPDYARLLELFKQMSREQQEKQVMAFNYYQKPLTASPPTAADYNSWKNADMYGVWLNDKHVSNNELDKYNAGDFKLASVSRLLKAARINKKYKYQVNLMTNAYFEKYNKEMMENPPQITIQYYRRG